MTEDASTRLPRADGPLDEEPGAEPAETPDTEPDTEPGDEPGEDSWGAVVRDQVGAEEDVDDTDGAAADGGRVLRGTSVAPGLVLGPVHRKGDDLAAALAGDRIPRDRVEEELNRFHGALVGARQELKDLKARLEGRVAADEARILDTHVTYLKDSVFISDVENLILNEQMALDAAIGKVVTDFDRIFRLVEDATLRERAVDLRDVGIRVLRHIERAEGGERATPSRYVLVARELSVVDMFDATGEHVLGIVTEEGGVTSHAAILARSMHVPTITGVEGLFDAVAEGDFVIVDASEGVVRVNPGELVRAQYQREERPVESRSRAGSQRATAVTRDGTRIQFVASCSNLPAVEEAVELGFDAIGLYRTELLYLVDRDPPGLDTLVAHYRAVLEALEASGPDPSVTLRLLHAESTLGLSYLHEGRETNPVLGEAGVRALFKRESVLRTQLRALALAAGPRPVRIAVPFVVDPSELRRVREVLFEERRTLPSAAKAGAALELGVVIETPAAVLMIEELASEADFVALHLVSLVQHLLATDRENAGLRNLFARPHPAVLRALERVTRACEAHDTPLGLFGVSTLPAYLPLLVGLGIRTFSIPPTELRELAELVAAIDANRAAADFEAAAGMASAAEIRTLMEGHLYGWARARSRASSAVESETDDESEAAT